MSVGWLLWWRPPALLRRVTVVLKDEQPTSLQGVLWRSRGAWLVLRSVTAVRRGEQPEPIDGEVIVHRVNVSFLQVLP